MVSAGGGDGWWRRSSKGLLPAVCPHFGRSNPASGSRAVARMGRVNARCWVAARSHGGSWRRAALRCSLPAWCLVGRGGLRCVRRPWWIWVLLLMLGRGWSPRGVVAAAVVGGGRLPSCCRYAQTPGENPASTLSLPAASVSFDAVSSLEVPLWSSSTYISLVVSG